MHFGVDHNQPNSLGQIFKEIYRAIQEINDDQIWYELFIFQGEITVTLGLGPADSGRAMPWTGEGDTLTFSMQLKAGGEH